MHSAKDRHVKKPFKVLASIFAQAAALLVVGSFCAAPVYARHRNVSLHRQTRVLARGADTATGGPQKSGTAFFVDDMGDMLTARHVVDDCRNVIVTKEGIVLTARVVALSSEADLALIKIPKTIGLAAVFPRSAEPSVNDMVFVAAYDNLSSLIASGGLLADATVVKSDVGSGILAIDSDVTFGASGAPVLDSGAHVQGVISRRTPENHVAAVSVDLAKIFLAANGIEIEEDDRPQIAALGSRAHRAASISAAVTCFQN
jgi:S1-C subfamily serine protease